MPIRDDRGFGMKREHKALSLIGLAVAVVVGLVSVNFLGVPSGPGLFIPAGTVVSYPGFKANFTVAGGPGRVVGAWHANDGGAFMIFPSDLHLGRIMDGIPIEVSPCLGHVPWNGSVDVSLAPGTYTIAFGTYDPGFDFFITQTIQVIYPGDSPGTNGTRIDTC